MDDTSIKSFISLIEEIDHDNRVNRDRGTLFELLVKTYLENEPLYQRLFDNVWMLNDVPLEYNIPKKDTGVDLVARKAKTGELVAIQCKYYSKDTTIRKEHIDSFLNEVGKNYYDEGLIITTSEKWSKNADEALTNRDKNILRISLTQLKESRIDWSKYSFSKPKTVVLKEKKRPRHHQIPAIKAVLDGFEKNDRGKMIMAPGTGKTYTSMSIAEEMAEKSTGTFKVLYLVPSIQLLSQTLRSWNADVSFNMDSIAVCSDRKVTKERVGTEIEDIATADIGFPATTSTDKLLEYQRSIEKRNDSPEFISVFSTYQSIDVIINAQKNGFYDFDLVICDEAHRTTGSTELNKEASVFTKVHNKENIIAKKRLYQTATPRVYGEDAKKKAEEKSVLIADMNDSETYGEEFYRIGFGDAIRKGILTDYKVMVLAVDEDVVARRFQDMFAKTESGLQFDDVTKIIGVWNGLVKRDGKTNKTLGQPMKRAIAFTGTIKDSVNITKMFSTVVDEYLYKNEDFKTQFNIDIQHADGTMNAMEKNEKIDWLKSEVPDNTCRVLSNARFLTEGVDVPDLDAVMFLKPRKSKIDIAQAVGRVMRKAEGKEYGYIILPIGVPSGAEAHSILDNNEKYAVAWEILNALRSIDERFDAIINKIELNKNKPNKISIIGVGDAPEDGELEEPPAREEQLALDLSEESLTDLEKAIYGKIVQKVGNVRYWEQWSEKVAEIAQQHISRINIMLEDKNSVTYKEFKKFMESLHHNINESITEQQAIEMLSQHLITKPVFEALFESYSFVNNNPVSKAMESILYLLNQKGLMREQEQLEEFYNSVRVRAEGIDNLKAKQEIIVQLYNKFFKTGFKETTERLGIVFTPVEVVDFIIRSVDNVISKHFNKSLSSEGVHVLDPFTGTGTFITRLLQSGVISKEDLLRKYTQEIHANEIVLLSYYIAAINIEETFHDLYGKDYLPFEGIVLTDTFESTEHKNSFMDELFNENNKRLRQQQEQPIFAIMGNPPYSAKKSNTNDDYTKVSYPLLDSNIRNTYAKNTNAVLKNALYDPYIKAIRWASDRIQDKGVVGFVTNNSFIDSHTMDGVRKCLYEEFNHIYVFNLRGDQRTQGEKSRKEGGKIFDSGSRTPIAITLLIKDGTDDHELNYYDIGEYLKREEKLKIIDDFKSINNIPWQKIIPDKYNDWINQKDEKYQEFIPLNEPKSDLNVFNQRLVGVATSRDPWVYGFSKTAITENVKKMISNYNNELIRLNNIPDKDERLTKINRSPSYVKWTRGLMNKFNQHKTLNFEPDKLIKSMYRPFTKKWLYYDSDLVEMPSRYHRYNLDESLMLIIPGNGSKNNFSALVTKLIPEKHLETNGQVLMLENHIIMNENSLFNNSRAEQNITNEFLQKVNLTEQDAFYYIYGLLHSKDYKENYKVELLKGSPRIPLVKEKKKFIKVGKKLADLHLNYENVDMYYDLNIEFKTDKPSYRVEQMKYLNKDDKQTIIFNSDITISNIPIEAYEYVVNGKSAIKWIMEQYQVVKDERTGIVDDPNLYSEDEKYIFNLLLRIINISMITNELVESLPKPKIIE